MADLHDRMARLEAVLCGEPMTAEERDRFEHLRRGRDVVRRIQADARCRPREVLAARREPGVDPAAADRVLRRLDLPTVLLD